jgi:hypothetical protein
LAKKLFDIPGRELLVKSVLSSMPTHFLTMFKMPKWAICGIKKFRMSFLWKGKESGKGNSLHGELADLS